MAAPTSGEGLTRAQFSVALRLIALAQVLYLATLHIVGGSAHLSLNHKLVTPGLLWLPVQVALALRSKPAKSSASHHCISPASNHAFPAALRKIDGPLLVNVCILAFSQTCLPSRYCKHSLVHAVLGSYRTCLHELRW